MKFYVSMNSKKQTNKMTMEELNQINCLVPTQEEEAKLISDQIVSQPDHVIFTDHSSPHDCPVAVNEMAENTNESMATENDNNHKDDSCSPDIIMLENCDSDSKCFQFKRVSLDRSLSWDDSGFNSCTSDDRDDVSERLSFDLTSLVDDDDEGVQTARQFPLRLRQRSYSLDSESSEFSDNSHFQNSKALSSSINNSELERNLVSWRGKLLVEGDTLLVKKVLKTNKNKKGSVDKKVVLSDTLSTSSRLVTPRRRHTGKDVNNNTRQNDSILKNLKSYHKPSSANLNSVLQNHGLLTLIACIFYTLFMAFVFGFCKLLLQVLKSYMSTEDLQDLRGNVARLQHEKQTFAVKDKCISTYRRRIGNKT